MQLLSEAPAGHSSPTTLRGLVGVNLRRPGKWGMTSALGPLVLGLWRPGCGVPMLCAGGGPGESGTAPARFPGGAEAAGMRPLL